MICFILSIEKKEEEEKIQNKIHKEFFQKNMEYKIYIEKQITDPIPPYYLKIYLCDFPKVSQQEDIAFAKQLYQKYDHVLFLYDHKTPLEAFSGIPKVSFLYKGPKFSKDFLSYIDYFLKEAKTKQYLVFQDHKQLLKIPTSEILYIEKNTMQRITIIHTKEMQLKTNISLQELENRLNSSFLRTHKSCLVNKNHIVSIDRKERIITLDNHEKIDLVSVRFLQKFMKNKLL